MSHTMYTHTEHKMAIDQSRFPSPMTGSTNSKHQNSTAYTQQARTITPMNLLYNHPSLLNQPSVSQLQLSPTPPQLLKPNGIPSSQDISSFSQLPKHWIWNSSFFYPNNRNIHDGFTPYSSNFSGIFSQSKTIFCESLKKSKDQSENYSNKINVTSDDSADEEDNSVRLVQTITVDQEASSTSSTNKKKNPYSIEELLKKPEKRIRTSDSKPFNPPIIIQENSNTYLDCIDTKNHIDKVKYEDNNNPIPFYE